MGWKGDEHAFHDDVSGEIDGLTEKATPVDADLVVIEDSADSNSKKKAQLSSLPGTEDHGGLTGLGDDDHTQYLLADGTRQATYVDVSGLTGATDASRYVGATTSGAPASGTFAVGDFVITQDGNVYVCTTAGSPGTWTQVGAAAATDSDAIHDNVAGEINAITEKASPASGDWLLIEDAADSNNKKKVDWDSLPSGGGGGATVPGWFDYLSVRQADETGQTEDDFFDDATLDAKWTTLTVTGSQTITEKYDRLSVHIDGTIAASDLNALLQSVTPSVGDVIETHIGKVMVSEAQDFVFAGLVFSDGTTSTSNKATLTAFKRKGGGLEDFGWFLSTRDGTFTASTADTVAADEDIMAPHDGLYLRLEYDAANSYKAFVSPDGITWIQVGSAFTSTAFTPTHMGLVWSNWGETADLTVISFDYFRYNPA